MASVSTSQTQCPLCGDSARFLFAKNAIGILECRKCKHRFADLEVDAEHVSRVYDDSYFTAGGAGYADYQADSALRIAQARRYAQLLRQFTVPGYMLDVGAGAGDLLSGFLQAGWKAEGVEPNARMAAIAQQSSGTTVHSCALESFSPTRQYDLVTLIQVLPHLPDVATCVKKVSGLIRPGGLCFVESWNRRSLTARMFGSHWHEYSPPSVLHWFDNHGTNELMKRHGLTPIANGHALKWISARHARSLLNHILRAGATGRFGAGLVKLIPGRMRIPYPGDDLVWLVFQKA